MNQSEKESQTQTNTPTDIPVESVSAATPVSASNIACGPVPSPSLFPPTRPLRSPANSTNSMANVASTDGNSQPSEEAQRSAPQQLEENLGEVDQLDSESVSKVLPPAEGETPTNPLLFRTSTPTQDLTSASTVLNLTQLETGLTIAPSSRTMLPELLPVAIRAAEVSAVSFLQTETDDGSSSCDAPRLPTGETKVRFLDDSTGAEETGDTSRQASGPPSVWIRPT